jgi:hypothetical protein
VTSGTQGRVLCSTAVLVPFMVVLSAPLIIFPWVPSVPEEKIKQLEISLFSFKD